MWVQDILTNGAQGWESFEIDGEVYLAVANHYNDSKIYRWDGTSFALLQDIPTNAANDWESFKIAGETYLVVANYHNGSTHNTDSRIYKWNGTSFVEIQAIPTNAARDWESFKIAGETYLVVANYYDDSTYNLPSRIYKWDDEFSLFVWEQDIFTSGAQGWESFKIDGKTYLAVAIYHDNYNRYVDSMIYRVSVLEVTIDIKPGSCPNPLNVKSKGVLPLAILGTESFDVTQIDPASVKLEDVPPLRWAYVDVATPFVPSLGKEDCLEDCNELCGDGYEDLILNFNRQEIVAALGEVIDGECIVVTITGNLLEQFNGTPIVGEDVLLILRKGW